MSEECLLRQEFAKGEDDARRKLVTLEAAPLFAEVVQHSSAPETLYIYAAFLKSQNRREEALQWTQQLFQKKRTLPRYWQRIERPWFRKGQALLKELQAETRNP